MKAVEKLIGMIDGGLGGMVMLALSLLRINVTVIPQYTVKTGASAGKTVVRCIVNLGTTFVASGNLEPNGNNNLCGWLTLDVAEEREVVVAKPTDTISAAAGLMAATQVANPTIIPTTTITPEQMANAIAAAAAASK